MGGDTPTRNGPGHWLICGLGYGDEGKGSVTDFLCSPQVSDPARTVVRYNGGAQAGHNVVTADGRHHTFSQFGSGTFHGARTFLSRFMMVDPLTLAAEARHLEEVGVRDPFSLLSVDAGALLVTPYHVAANRARERARGAGRHGSCGMGIGETAAWAAERPSLAPRWGDLLSPDILYGKLQVLRDHLEEGVGPLDPDIAWLAGALFRRTVREVAERTTVAMAASHLKRDLASAPAVFEGAQGVLLDEQYGFAPYTTWSTTTFANAEKLLGECGAMTAGVTRLGVIRAYMTRHGPGPFPTEDPSLRLPEPHNITGPWQGTVRQGHLDAVAVRYALDVAGRAAGIALTHADTAAACGQLRICGAYETSSGPVTTLAGLAAAGSQEMTATVAAARPVYGDPVADWPEAVSDALGVPVTVVSAGPAADGKRIRAVSPAWAAG